MKAKAGRPAIAASERRETMVRFLVTKDEMKQIRATAKALTLDAFRVFAGCLNSAIRGENVAQQSGYIFQKGDWWFLCYRDAGKQRCKKLADVCDRYRRVMDVQPLAAEFLAPFNAGKVRPESHMLLAISRRNSGCPVRRKFCKPSTVYG